MDIQRLVAVNLGIDIGMAIMRLAIVIVAIVGLAYIFRKSSILHPIASTPQKTHGELYQKQRTEFGHHATAPMHHEWADSHRPGIPGITDSVSYVAPSTY